VSGETLAAWVAQHGPMPADATLRVAEQIVSVLSSPPVFTNYLIQPLNPPTSLSCRDKLPKGGWPVVKLTNFGLAE